MVVTSVTRDDLPDGGAAVFAETITQLRQQIPGVRIEVLIPDFQGNPEALQTVLKAAPDVLNHNIETVARHVPPEEFDHWRLKALGMGFEQVASGPFVRSSYNAEAIFHELPPHCL